LHALAVHIDAKPAVERIRQQRIDTDDDGAIAQVQPRALCRIAVVEQLVPAGGAK